jgi:hypothetical protein
MTHLPYIVAAYAISLVVPVTFAVLAQTRLAGARRRLAALDPRAARPRPRK